MVIAHLPFVRIDTPGRVTIVTRDNTMLSRKGQNLQAASVIPIPEKNVEKVEAPTNRKQNHRRRSSDHGHDNRGDDVSTCQGGKQQDRDQRSDNTEKNAEQPKRPLLEKEQPTILI